MVHSTLTKWFLIIWDPFLAKKQKKSKISIFAPKHRFWNCIFARSLFTQNWANLELYTTKVDCLQMVFSFSQYLDHFCRPTECWVRPSNVRQDFVWKWKKMAKIWKIHIFCPFLPVNHPIAFCFGSNLVQWTSPWVEHILKASSSYI